MKERLHYNHKPYSLFKLRSRNIPGISDNGRANRAGSLNRDAAADATAENR